MSLDTLGFPVYDGSHTLTSRAYDEDGNVTTSSGSPITVANTSGTKYRGSISASGVPLEWTYDPAGAITNPIAVTLVNNSTSTWQQNSIKLRYRWYSADPTSIIASSANISIGSNLAAGGTRNLTAQVDPPTLPTGVLRGRYRLQVES